MIERNDSQLEEEGLGLQVRKWIDWYDRKALIEKRLQSLLQIGQMLTITAVPVLIFLGFQNKVLITISGILAIIASILTGLLLFLRPGAQWEQYRSISDALTREYHEFIAQVGHYDIESSAERQMIFHDRIDHLLFFESSLWSTTKPPSSLWTIVETVEEAPRDSL